MGFKPKKLLESRILIPSQIHFHKNQSESLIKNGVREKEIDH